MAPWLPSRVVIAGGPRSGKSTLARELAAYSGTHFLRGTDELMGLGWSESSLVASDWFDRGGQWICEGVVVPRALRKWLARVPDVPPADMVLWTNQDVTHRSPGQHAMAKGCDTVWREILPELLRRGTALYEI